MKLPRMLALVALLASPPDVASAARAASDCDLDCWRTALELYAASPAEHGRSLVELSRGGMEGLPPIAHLAVADARLRLGQRRAADRVFEDVIDGTTDEPWRSWAVAGRAWVAMQLGDVRGARHLLQTHVGSGEPDGVVLFSLGMLEASGGDPVAGIELLEAVRTRESSPRSLRIAAEMGIGLAHSWSGSHERALEIFEGLAARPSALAVKDEALFAAARTRIELGDEAGGFRLLEELAGRRSARRTRPSGAMASDSCAIGGRNT